MNILPFILIRLSPEKFSELSRLSIRKDIMDSLIAYFELEYQLMALSKRLKDSLFEIISNTKDHRKRRRLIELRRSILSRLQLKMPPPDVFPEKSFIAGSIQKYNTILIQVEHQRTDFHSIINSEINCKRQLLKNLFKNTNLLNGLLLSSRSLFDEREKTNETQSPNITSKRDVKIEKGLLKYSSRLFAKTSPFSTFTQVGILPVITGQSENHRYPLSFSFDDRDSISGFTTVSYIRFNNYLLQLILEILKQYSPFFLKATLRLNPTLELRDNKFNFLFSTNNVDIFQQIDNLPLLNIIFAVLTAKKEGIIYNELLKFLKDVQLEITDEEKTITYIKQLINYGFLEFDLGISGVDPIWDKSLCDLLKTHYDESDEVILELINTLTEIRKLAEEYQISSVMQRKVLTVNCYNRIKDIYFKLHKAADLSEKERTISTNIVEGSEKAIKQRKASQKEKADRKNEQSKTTVHQSSIMHISNTVFHFKPEQIFYEDVNAKLVGNITTYHLEPVLKNVQSLVNELPYFAAVNKSRQEVRDSFIECFGEDSDVPLLQFYHKYSEVLEERFKIDRDNKNTHQTIIHENEKLEVEREPLTFEKDGETARWKSLFLEKAKALIDVSKPSVKITADMLSTINNEFFSGKINKSECTSQSAFLQCFYESKSTNHFPELLAVLNGITPGYGKMFSRFLHLFPEEVYNCVIEKNIELQKDSLLVENKDSSYFNANIHPPLLDYELCAPGSHNFLPKERQISVTQLIVKYNKTHKMLELKDVVTGKAVRILDLGFQGSYGRSEFFNFLRIICEDDFVMLNTVIDPINEFFLDHTESISDNKSFRFFPRIIFNDNLVIQRKAWLFEIKDLPTLDQKESEVECFIKINRWRLKHDIPDNIFVKLAHKHRDNSAIQNAVLQSKRKRDDYKPQYINFTNPFLVNLLPDLFLRTEGSIYFEEMLPGPDQLLPINDCGHVTEFCIQWNN